MGRTAHRKERCDAFEGREASPLRNGTMSHPIAVAEQPAALQWRAQCTPTSACADAEGLRAHHDVAHHLGEEGRGEGGRGVLLEEGSKGLVHNRLIELGEELAVGLHEGHPDRDAVLPSEGLDEVLEGHVAPLIVCARARAEGLCRGLHGAEGGPQSSEDSGLASVGVTRSEERKIWCEIKAHRMHRLSSGP